MNRNDTKDYISFSHPLNFTCLWSQLGTTLAIFFEPGELTHGTMYKLKIEHQITDKNGNPMTSDFEFIFTTASYPPPPQSPEPQPSSQEPLFPIGMLIIFIILVIGLMLILISYFGGKKDDDLH